MALFPVCVLYHAAPLAQPALPFKSDHTAAVVEPRRLLYVLVGFAVARPRCTRGILIEVDWRSANT